MFSDTISAFGEAKEIFHFNDTTEGFQRFQKQSTKMYEVIYI